MMILIPVAKLVKKNKMMKLIERRLLCDRTQIIMR
jgi:hypothetical protein